MDIRLKNVKVAKFASEETLCFEASVWIDGKRAGTASNAGKGGPNSYWPRDLEEQLQRHAETLPPRQLLDDKPEPTYQPGADDLIGDALEEWELQQLCRRNTMFRHPGQKYAPGSWTKMARRFSPALRALIVAKYPGAVFANEGAR